MDDVYFEGERPFPEEYPRIFRIHGNGHHNVRRIASQMGDSLAQREVPSKILKRRGKNIKLWLLEKRDAEEEKPRNKE